MKTLVLHDPMGDFNSGHVVNTAMAGRLKLQGACLIPYDPDLESVNAASPFYRRDWGHGVELDDAILKVVCPMVLYMMPRSKNLYWRACIAVDDKTLAGHQKGEPMAGSLRLMTDTGQSGARGGGMGNEHNTSFNFKDLVEPPDQFGHWYIGGAARAHVAVENFHGFALYGAGRGVRVIWSALSQTD